MSSAVAESIIDHIGIPQPATRPGNVDTAALRHSAQLLSSLRRVCRDVAEYVVEFKTELAADDIVHELAQILLVVNFHCPGVMDRLGVLRSKASADSTDCAETRRGQGVPPAQTDPTTHASAQSAQSADPLIVTGPGGDYARGYTPHGSNVHRVDEVA